MSKDRVEAFSDGVFSVVLTLFVLSWTMPRIADHSSLGQYSSAMAPLIPKTISLVLTFVMICIHWVSHHYFFRHLQRVTVGFVWLNNLFLLWLCFLPFPTAMLGDHPTDQFPILLYGVNSLLCTLTFYGFRSYANYAKLFRRKEFAEAHGPRHSIPAIVLYTLSIALSFVNTHLSLACFFIVPILYFMPNLIQDHLLATSKGV